MVFDDLLPWFLMISRHRHSGLTLGSTTARYARIESPVIWCPRQACAREIRTTTTTTTTATTTITVVVDDV
jgi:hypothetical protein